MVATGETTQLTAGADGESSPRWSPDGRAIAFIAKRPGDEVGQIYLLPVTGGEATRLTAHDAAPTALAWMPDGDAILFVAPEAKTAAEKAREKAKDDVYAFEEDYKQTHLWRVEVPVRASASGAAGVDRPRQRASPAATSPSAPSEIARDGAASCTSARRSRCSARSDRGEIWIMDADGKGAVAVTRNGIAESGAYALSRRHTGAVHRGRERAARGLSQRQGVRGGDEAAARRAS